MVIIFTMISSYLMGGLGNQLFQICAAMALSQQFETPFKFVYSTELTVGTRRPTYWDTFLSELKTYTTFDNISNKTLFDKANSEILNSNFIKEQGFEYSPILLPSDCKRHNYILYGYFQSYRYFDTYFSKICDIIKLQQKQEYVKTRCLSLFDEVKTRPLVSIHFRIGDYKLVQESHNILSLKYYIAAIQKIIERTDTDKLRIVYFYEQKDSETVSVSIKVLNRTFPNIEFIGVDQRLSDWEQMMLMSLCDHNIIANSTYSWWGAYFNQNSGKVVVYPAQWFGPKLTGKKTDDLFPSEWIKIVI
jgi:hypothetical protein